METQKKTFAEIVSYLQEKLKESDDDYEYGSIQRFDEMGAHSLSELGIGEIIHKSEGAYGGSNKGSNYVRVYYFADHDIYIEISGYYSSYEGTSFQGRWEECAKEVRPYQEIITIYK